MSSMGQKNRRKKALRNKKSAAKAKKPAAPPVAEVKAAPRSTEPAASTEIEPEELDGGGMMIQMRSLISGGKQEKEGFFSRRRTLAEWLVWFGGLIGIYYLVRAFMAE